MLLLDDVACQPSLNTNLLPCSWALGLTTRISGVSVKGGAGLASRAPARASFDVTGKIAGIESVFTWHWLANVCARQHIPLVLGHALWMKFVHETRTENDGIDSREIGVLLKVANFALAFVCSPKMRATPDLLRRRMCFSRDAAEDVGLGVR